jgi:hypothetical protein
MTLDEADVLLAQWADWAANELSKLGHSTSKWHDEYRPGFLEENTSNDLPAGDEQVMIDVDTALALVKVFNPFHFQVIRGRYMYRESYNRYQLDSAKRAFITEYASPLDNDFENPLALIQGLARPQ